MEPEILQHLGGFRQPGTRTSYSDYWRQKRFAEVRNSAASREQSFGVGRAGKCRREDQNSDVAALTLGQGVSSQRSAGETGTHCSTESRFHEIIEIVT